MYRLTDPHCTPVKLKTNLHSFLNKTYFNYKYKYKVSISDNIYSNYMHKKKQLYNTKSKDIELRVKPGAIEGSAILQSCIGNSYLYRKFCLRTCVKSV